MAWAGAKGRTDVIALRALAGLPPGAGDAGARARADGARSRAATAALLATLAQDGFEVETCDDDHLVVGAPGASLVASRDFAYPLSLGRRGELWTGCYPVVGLLEGLAVRAAETADALGTPVDPVLAVHRAAVPAHLLRTAGVTVVAAARSLVALLRDAPPRIDAAEVHRVVAAARQLRPTPRPR